MKVSTKGRYALRFMIYLANHQEQGAITLKEVCQKEEISLKYLEQIAALLSKQNVILATRGPKGGYQLAKKANEYCIGEILEVVEGSVCPVSCLDDSSVQCPRAKECTTIAFWRGLHDVIETYLNAYTLEDLANMSKKERNLVIE